MQDQFNSKIDSEHIFLIYTTTPAPQIDQPQSRLPRQNIKASYPLIYAAKSSASTNIL